MTAPQLLLSTENALPYYLQITMSSLSNPKAVWFLGAPVSKAIAITAVVTYVVAEMNKIHNALVFGKSNKITQKIRQC